ncbi:MAG: carboxypeptidase regulatory-like domain-containing protein, partial [Acidobacteria bacterium]|nr:carboxypeptidase regulatory-like domain-containing protein [Acidobacteriota bacterium]
MSLQLTHKTSFKKNSKHTKFGSPVATYAHVKFFSFVWSAVGLDTQLVLWFLHLGWFSTWEPHQHKEILLMTKQALRKSVWSFGLIALLGLLVIPTLTVAQDGTGFRGRVVDTTGAVMVGVTITATSEAKGLTYSTATNEVGEYELRGLLPDTYTLTAEATGFKRYENTGVIVYSQSPRRVDITMEIGELADAITVTEEGARIETDTPSVTYKTPNKEVYYTN